MRVRFVGCTILLTVSTVLCAQINVDFQANQTTGCGTLQAEFADLSTSTGGAIVEWQWELGAGVISSLQNPGRIFTEPGSYDICLTVTDASGNTASKCEQQYIEIYDIPKVAFSADRIKGCAPLVATFVNLTQSQDPIAELVWDLGGEMGVVMGTTELDTISAEYTKPDDYTVSLIATTDKGCSNVAVRESYVQVGGIERPSITADQRFNCTAPHNTRLIPDGLSESVDYSWGIRDSALTALDSSASFTFNSQGLFDIIIGAFDPATGCSDTFLFEDVVQIGLLTQPTVNTPVSCTDYQFSFTDSLMTDPDSVLWEFGDGNVSRSRSPKHSYPVSGCYNVSLTVYKNGCIATTSLDTCVEVRERPDIVLSDDGLAKCGVPASFDLSTSSPEMTSVRWTFPNSLDTIFGQSIELVIDSLEGTIPFEVSGRYLPGCRVSFSDSLYVGELEAKLLDVAPLGCIPAVGAPRVGLNADFEIVDWQWEVTGVDTSFTATGAQPGFQISEAGGYSLGLIVTSSEGCVDTVHAPNYFKAGTRPDLSFEADILFTCSDTTINFQAFSSTPLDDFFWDFGDGGNSVMSSPGYVFTDTGSFTVVLEAGYNGCYAIDSIVDYIEILGPVSKFSAVLDCDLNRLRLEDRSIAADDIQWEILNDGDVIFEASSDSILEIDLPPFGFFEVVQYSENYGTGCTDVHRDTIELRPPELDVTFTPNSGCAPLEVTVLNNSSDFEDWQWTVPGGILSSETLQNPIITFNKPGLYDQIEVSATDPNGCPQTIALDKHIAVGAIRPQLGDRMIVCEESLFELSMANQPGIPVTEWSWVVRPGPQLLTGERPLTSLADTGFYTVELTTIDSIGCSTTIKVDSFIQVVSGETQFSGDTAGCVDQSFRFVISSPDLNIAYAWDFGDGALDTGQIVKHAYAQQGSYLVCATSLNLPDCQTTTCREVTVTEVTADFTSDIQFANCPPLLVNFENLSINGIEYSWSFGDESGRSVLDDPAHVYANAGAYDVQLIARLRGACADTVTKSNFIVVDGPSGEFTLDASDGCAPIDARLIGTSNDIYQYVWDFGNGQLDSSTIRVSGDTARVIYSESGDFVPSLTLIDDDNCRVTFQSNDTVFVRRDFLDAGSDRTICIGESILIAPDLNSGTANWLPHPIIEDTSTLLLDISPDSNITLTIVGVDKACTLYDTLTIEVLERAQVTGGEILACRGDSVLLTATGIYDQVSWFDSDWRLIQDSSNVELTIAGSIPVFNVIASLSTCIDDTTSFNINVPDEIKYRLPERVTVYPSEPFEVPLSLVSANVGTITWTPEDKLDCPSCINPVITTDTSTLLRLRMTEAQGNCFVEDSILAFVPSACNKNDIFIPNVFTPNGDGVNDHISLETEKISTLLAFDVYDRWGSKVFSSDRIDFQWEGRYSGADLPAGVYTYILHAVCPIDGTPLFKTGDITLLR